MSNVSNEAFKDALHAELRRRLDEMGDGGDDQSVGRFDQRDWTAIGLLLLVLPLAATWWFAS